MENLTPTDTEVWLARARTGDASAFAALCEQYRQRVWRIVRSVVKQQADAEDLMQEAFVRAWCHLASYRADAPFEAWLCRIALHAAHDYQKSAWRRRVFFWSEGKQRPDPVSRGEGDSPHDAVERRETQRRVRAAVAALGPKERVPIYLSYFEGFTFADIARLEKVSESTLRSRVKAGLKRLQKTLADLEAGEETATTNGGQRAMVPLPPFAANGCEK